MATGGVSPRLPNTGLESYAVNNILDGDPLYIGKVQTDGRWVVQKYGVSVGTMVYANISNNAGTTDYNTAWANRLTLNYGGFDTLMGV